MEGMLQKHYQHRVPKENENLGPRINLTWRWIARHNSKCPCDRKRPLVHESRRHIDVGQSEANKQNGNHLDEAEEDDWKNSGGGGGTCDDDDDDKDEYVDYCDGSKPTATDQPISAKASVPTPTEQKPEPAISKAAAVVSLAGSGPVTSKAAMMSLPIVPTQSKAAAMVGPPPSDAIVDLQALAARTMPAALQQVAFSKSTMTAPLPSPT